MCDLLAGWAADRLHLMFGHHQLERGQIVDLAPLDHLAYDALQRALAGATGRRTMDHLDIGNRNLGKSMPNMTGLAARLAATLDPLTARAAVQSITGGRFAAVVAIFGKPPQEGLHLRL
jgi:hypothetical protein